MREISIKERGQAAVATLVVIGAVLLVAVITFVGYQVGWWFKTQNTNRQVKLDNRNIGTQTAWHDEAVQDIRDYNLLDDSHSAQKNAIKNQACDLITRLSDSYRSDDIVQFESEHCL